MGGRECRITQEAVRVLRAYAYASQAASIDLFEISRRLLVNQFVKRIADIGNGERSANRPTDWERPGTEGKPARPGRPRDLIQFFLQHGVRAVGVNSHADRNFSFGIGVADLLFKLASLLSFAVLLFTDVLDRLLGTPHELHNAFRHV